MYSLKAAISQTRRCSLIAALLVAGSACVDPTGPATDSYPIAGASRAMGSREVTIDFSSFGHGKVFEPDFYRSDGIVFSDEACGSSGCQPWFVGFIQGDAALVGDPRLGPVSASFKRPISGISISVAPSFLGTATYELKVFSASGALVGTASVTVTQDPGDPAHAGFGYFTISATNLSKAGKSFTLDNVFVRSSAPIVTVIPYGVSSITYTY